MYNHNSPFSSASLLGGYMPKRKIFVSYHHANDQGYYNHLSRTFSDTYNVIHDNSLDRTIDSTNTEYVMRIIRENHIKGTSCTLVLCGEETPNRKYVDWETKASLDNNNALIGIYLPTARKDNYGNIIVPDRFYTNHQAGFARFVSWDSLFNAQTGLKHIVEEAVRHAQPNTRLINNSAPLMSRNKSSSYSY
jgi:hypothetical protein